MFFCWLLETFNVFGTFSEQGLRQMAVLKISDHHGADGQHVTELAKSCQRPLTLSELFLMGPGRKARALLVDETRNQVNFSNKVESLKIETYYIH